MWVRTTTYLLPTFLFVLTFVPLVPPFFSGHQVRFTLPPKSRVPSSSLQRDKREDAITETRPETPWSTYTPRCCMTSSPIKVRPCLPSPWDETWEDLHVDGGRNWYTWSLGLVYQIRCHSRYMTLLYKLRIVTLFIGRVPVIRVGMYWWDTRDRVVWIYPPVHYSLNKPFII